MRRAADKANLVTIPKSLPIYVFSGGADPVHNQMRNLQRMIDAYVGVGLAVSTKIYAEGRHESFNEVNRDEVIGESRPSGTGVIVKALANPAAKVEVTVIAAQKVE